MLPSFGDYIYKYFLSWRLGCCLMGSNDVQAHKGIDDKPQMKPNVKSMMIKDSKKIDTLC